MTALADGRVVAITGAGQGIGREHALEFARHGARVVVNDLQGAEAVAAEICADGGEAIAHEVDASDWDGAAGLVERAVAAYGDLHAVVNNAGILRDKMVVGMEPAQWDDVIRVHLRSTFCTTRHAAAYWRERDRAGTPTADPRIVNTSSPSGLFGNVGQSNYGSAKAAIATFTVITADELARYGIGVNAIAPTAVTAMTAGLESYVAEVAAEKARTGFDAGSPANISPLVVWLASPQSDGVTGRVFTVKGGEIGVAETWVKGPRVVKECRWEADELGAVIPGLVAQARPNSRINGSVR